MTTTDKTGPHPDRILFDFDQHYYEPKDAFVRYIDEEYKVDSLRFETGPNNENWTVLNGEPLWDWPDWNPPVDEEAGTEDFFGDIDNRDFKQAEIDANRVEWFSSVPASWQDPSERVKVLDKHGVDATIMLPTLGVEFPEQVAHRPELLMAMTRAFNRWLEDDWTYNYQNRIFSVAEITLVDVDFAIEELDRVVALGAKAIWLHTAPVQGRSPGDVYFDRFWDRVEHHDVLVTFHLSGVSPYPEAMENMWGSTIAPKHKPLVEWPAFIWLTCFGDRPIADMVASLIYWNLFERHPKLRVALVEYGSGWVEYTLRRMDKMSMLARKGGWPGGKLPKRPSDIFREHFWVVPFPEDRIGRLVEFIGADNVLFGSDYPHPEGLPVPPSFADRLENFGQKESDQILGGNAAKLLNWSPQ